MKTTPRDKRPPAEGKVRGAGFYYSLLLHAAIVLVFVVGLDFASTPTPVPLAGDSKIINATAVDSKAVAQEIKKLKSADQAKQQEADRKVKDAEERRKNEEKAIEKLKAEKQAENRKLEQEKQKLLQEKEQVVKEKEQVEQQKIAEKKKLEEQQQKLEEQKKVEEKKQQGEEAKKKAADEAKKAEENKKADDAKKKADEKKQANDAKKKAEAKRKADEAKALADELAAEEAELASANQARGDQSELARWNSALTAQVTRNFMAPDLNSGLKCTLQIRMIATGEVVDARVIKSSGNTTYDRQAELAVRKASPLPMPESARLVQMITSQPIQFEFDPSGIN